MRGSNGTVRPQERPASLIAEAARARKG